MRTEKDYLDLPDELPKYPVAGCRCMTKTPDPLYHERYCAVWMYWRILQLEKRLREVENGNSDQ